MRASTLLCTVLGIHSIVVRGFHMEPEGIVVDVGLRRSLPRCGECGIKARRVKDKRSRRWRHLDICGMKVHLRYDIRRVHCEACSGVKTERVPWGAHGAGFTHAFDERAAYLAQQSSQTAVSKLLRVAWITVGRIIRRVVDQRLETGRDRLEGLRHIGIDELSYRRHHEYVTVVVDHERSVVVWSAKGKNADTVRAFFEELGPDRSAQIESVTIDMSNAYISAVREKVPDACLVFDRFHVQRLVQDALDETRRDMVREAESREEAKAFKKTRWALLKGPWNLTAKEGQTLERLELDNRPLFRAYLLKESLAAILDRRQINVARGMLEQWIQDATASGLDHFAKAARTIDRHKGGILEYVRSRFTNARVEGLNGKIRTITRRAYGFHSARALIAMIFLCCGGVQVTPAFSSPDPFH